MVGAVPGVGTTVELVRVLNNAGQAFNAGVDAAADLTKIGSEAAVKVHAITEKVGDLAEEASNIAESAVPGLPERPEIDIPKVTAPGLGPLPGAPEKVSNPVEAEEGSEGIQAGGGMRTLNQLQKAGKRIENRVESSLKEFNKNTKTRKKVRFNL